MHICMARSKPLCLEPAKTRNSLESIIPQIMHWQLGLTSTQVSAHRPTRASRVPRSLRRSHRTHPAHAHAARVCSYSYAPNRHCYHVVCCGGVARAAHPDHQVRQAQPRRATRARDNQSRRDERCAITHHNTSTLSRVASFLSSSRVSSVLNDSREFGKQNLFDGAAETCWNSAQGKPQFSQDEEETRQRKEERGEKFALVQRC